MRPALDRWRQQPCLAAAQTIASRNRLGGAPGSALGDRVNLFERSLSSRPSAPCASGGIPHRESRVPSGRGYLVSAPRKRLARDDGFFDCRLEPRAASPARGGAGGQARKTKPQAPGPRPPLSPPEVKAFPREPAHGPPAPARMVCDHGTDVASPHGRAGGHARAGSKEER
jgi:hypothetical protein